MILNIYNSSTWMQPISNIHVNMDVGHHHIVYRPTLALTRLEEYP